MWIPNYDDSPIISHHRHNLIPIQKEMAEEEQVEQNNEEEKAEEEVAEEPTLGLVTQRRRIIKPMSTKQDAYHLAWKFSEGVCGLYSKGRLFRKEDLRALFSEELRQNFRGRNTNHYFEVAWALIGNTQREWNSREANVEVIEYSVFKDRIVEITFREYITLQCSYGSPGVSMDHPVRAVFVWTLSVDHFGKIGKLVAFRRESLESYFKPAWPEYGAGTYSHPII